MDRQVDDPVYATGRGMNLSSAKWCGEIEISLSPPSQASLLIVEIILCNTSAIPPQG